MHCTRPHRVGGKHITALWAANSVGRGVFVWEMYLTTARVPMRQEVALVLFTCLLPNPTSGNSLGGIPNAPLDTTVTIDV